MHEEIHSGKLPITFQSENPLQKLENSPNENDIQDFSNLLSWKTVISDRLGISRLQPNPIKAAQAASNVPYFLLGFICRITLSLRKRYHSNDDVIVSLLNDKKRDTRRLKEKEEVPK